MRILPYSAVLLALGLHRPALAQSLPADSTTLAPVVITATRDARALKTQPSTITVLDGATLRAEGITHLTEALRRVPGFARARSSSFGSQTSMFLRGGQSNYVRLLIDGVPVNEPGGVLDLGRITLDDIERIEVVRGPASVLYGSEAVTGVIQLFTRRATERAVDAELGAGNYGATRAGLSLSGARTRAAWSLRGDQHRTDGILAFNNAYRNDGAVGTLRLTPDDRSDLALTARYNASTYEYPTGSDGSVTDRNAERTEHRLLLGLDGGRRITDRIETRLQLASNELHPRTSDGADSPGDTLGFFGYFASGVVTRRIADLRTIVQLRGTSRLAVGAELARDHERSRSLSQSAFGPFPGDFEAARNNRALYAQALGDLGALSYTLGGRVDDNSAFGTFRTARLGMAWRLTEKLRLRGSTGTAFKAPSFFENYATGFTVGNAQLRPETSRSSEMGIELTLPRGYSARVTGFGQQFRDMIQYTGRPPIAGAPNYYNVAAANAGGLEVETAVQDILGFSAEAQWSWTKTRVVDAGFNSGASANFVKGESLLRRPAHMGSLRIGHRLGRAGSISAVVAHSGARDDRDFSTFPATPVILSSYTTLDLGAEHPLPMSWLRGARLSWRVENLFDARYQEIARFEAPGRAVWVGLKLHR